MKRFDFWKIAPEEGKYVMAVKWNSKRRMAVCFAIIYLN